jgi:hypothetical protein
MRRGFIGVTASGDFGGGALQVKLNRAVDGGNEGSVFIDVDKFFVISI